MMSQTIQSHPQALVESLVRKLAPHAQEDARQLFHLLLENLTALSPGGNLLQAGGPKEGSSAPPTGVSHSVTGGNAAFGVAITNPPNERRPIYHEISYSPFVSFTKDVTIRPPTTDTSINIPSPGVKAFFRRRSSFDKKTWTNYVMHVPQPVDAGLIGSEATAPGAAFNQTNYAVVSSQAIGSASLISISGPSGPLTPYTAVKGSKESLRPSATIIGLPYGPAEFVGWDGSQYQAKSTLAEVLADDLEPVGAVSIGNGKNGGGGTAGGNGGRLTQDLSVMMGTIG